MKVIVLVKEVPDTYGDRQLNLETGLADRAASDAVIDEISERAIEAGLAHAEAHEGVEVTLLSLAPEGSVATIRKGLAMGADRAVHVADAALLGADVMLTAETLAAAISREGFDLVIAGNASTDGSSGMVSAAIAEVLGVAHLSGLNNLEVAASRVSGSRHVDGGVQQLAASLPAVVSITEALPDPRFPNFKGIVAAKKKPFETLTLAELGIDAERPDAARSIMLTVAEKPPRAAGVKITDAGDAGAKLAEFLFENRLA